jgi:hypothetical protein
MSIPTIVSRANFDELLLGSNLPTVVCFYKKSSGSSEIVKAEIENKQGLPVHLLNAIYLSCTTNLAKRFDERATFVRVNVDETKDIAAKYKVSAVPTQVIFRERA